MLKVKIDLPEFQDSEIEDIARDIYNNDAVGIAIAETAAKEMDPFVPFLNGPLSQTYITEPFKVTYTVPYAHYQYVGEDFEHTVEFHPNATAYWDRAMIQASGKKFEKEVEDIILRGGK